MSKPKPPTPEQEAAREKEKNELLWHLAGKGNQKAKDAIRDNAKGGDDDDDD